MQERYIAAVDLGSSKIALTVAKVNGDNTQMIYYKETPSDGIRNSSVYNPMRAGQALRNALDQAEGELGIKILQIVVGLPRYSVCQESGTAGIDRSDPNSCITQEEINNLKSMALESYVLDDETKEEIYGAVAQSFSADEQIQQSEQDVVGSPADKLEGNFKIFVGAKKSSNNIDIMLNKLGVAPAKKIFLPHAVANVVLTEEERDNGVALVEVGGGVTSLTIYQGGILRYYGAIPFGGKSITTDIKYECGFKETLAENVKLAFGACMPEKLQSLSEKTLQINDEETGSYEHLPVKYLSEIITARAREIIEAVLYHIQVSGYADKLRNGVVLTGGCASLANFSNLLKDMSGYNVRIGYPRLHQFSAEGCPGISDTSAVSSVGLIFSAKKDPLLNCTAPVTEKPEQEEEEETKASADFTGTVFEPIEETPRPAKAKKPSNGPKITWTKRLGKKLSGALDGVFEGTVGTLYDNIQE